MSYSLPIIISRDAMTTFFTGALGAMTFGAYSQFQADKIMKLNNQIQAQILMENNRIQEQKTKKLLDEQELKFSNMLKESHRKWL